MSKSNELLKMYQDPHFKNFKEEILRGLGIGGGVAELNAIIASENSEVHLIKAVKQLGIMSRSKSSQSLIQLYSRSDQIKVKEAIIQSLFVQSNARGLIDIIKSESKVELKRSALKKLSLLGSDEALDYFSDVLNDRG